MTTYALNGLGRIGKLALRPLLEQGAKVAFINDAVGDPAAYAAGETMDHNPMNNLELLFRFSRRP